MTTDLERAARAHHEKQVSQDLAVGWASWDVLVNTGSSVAKIDRMKAALLSLSDPSDEVVEAVARQVAVLWGEHGDEWSLYKTEAKTIISSFIKSVVGEP